MSTPFGSKRPAPTEIYTLSLHDALPISVDVDHVLAGCRRARCTHRGGLRRASSSDRSQHHEWRRGTRWHVHHQHSGEDRKSTRLNSSHVEISYAVFCLKKKKHRKDCSAR